MHRLPALAALARGYILFANDFPDRVKSDHVERMRVAREHALTSRRA